MISQLAANYESFKFTYRDFLKTNKPVEFGFREAICNNYMSYKWPQKSCPFGAVVDG